MSNHHPWPSYQPGMDNPHLVVMAAPRPPSSDLKYSANDRATAKRCSVMQLVIGLLCVVFQSVATGYQSRFDQAYDRFESYFSYGSFSMTRYGFQFSPPSLHAPDNAGTGIWVGLLIFLTGCVGVTAAQANKKGRIGAHLGLNVLLLMVTPALIATSSVTVGAITRCKRGSSEIDDYFMYQQAYSMGTFMGEDLDYAASRCNTFFYSIWLAMAIFLVVLSVTQFLLTLILIVINSKAVCAYCCCYWCREYRNVTPFQVIYVGGNQTPGSTYPTQGIIYPVSPGSAFPAQGNPPSYSSVYPTMGSVFIPQGYSGSTAPPPYSENAPKVHGLVVPGSMAADDSPPAYQSTAQLPRNSIDI